MADVTMATVGTGTGRGMRNIVFVSPTRGFAFFIGSASATLSSIETTDGGVTWSGTVNQWSAATTNIAFDVWYDQWTPGDSGTSIHLWYFDSTADTIIYRKLTPNATPGNGLTNTIGPINAFVGASAVAGRGAFCSGTKTRSGYLYCAFDIDAGAERGLVRSTDGGTTWSANLSTGFVAATIDQCLLFPTTGSGDNNDVVAIMQSATGDTLSWRGWDSSLGSISDPGSTAFNGMIENTTDLTGQMGFSATIRHSDGAIIVVVMSDRDTVTADMKVYVFNGDISLAPGVTAKTNITTDIDDIYYPAVFIDQNTNNIYVAYNGKRDGSEVLGTTTKIYYTKSTDGGTTWTSGDIAYQEGAASANFQVWAPLSGPRFYVGWRVGTTLVGNAVNAVNVGKALIASQGSYALTGQAAILTGPPKKVVASQGAYALTGLAATLAKGKLMTAVQGAYALTGQTSNLLFGRKLVAVQGVYSETGSVTNLIWKRILLVVQGAYSYTGIAANFVKLRAIVAAQGSYVLTGVAANPFWGHKMVAVQGVYSETGFAANLLRGPKLAAAFGSYVLTGVVTLLRKALKLPTVQGSYAVNGQAANLLFGHRLSLNVGFYVLVGPDVTLVKGTQRILTASFGAYSVAGQPTVLLWKHVIPAAQGAYTYTGRTSNLLRGSRLTSGQGAYSYNGVPANLLFGRKLGTIQGVYIYTGQSAILFKGRFVTASQGSYVRTGFASNLLWKRIVAAAQGGYLLSGVSANFLRGRRVTTIQGAYILTGEPANLVKTAVKTLFASQGAYALVGQPSNMLWKRKMTLVQGTYIYTGSLVNLLKGRTMSGTFGSYNLTGQPSAFRQSRVMPTSVGLYGLTGFPVLFHHPPAPLFGVTGTYVLSGFPVTFSINEITFFYYIDLTQDENDPTESELVGTSSESGGFKYVFP